jgi:hypothetical protein
MEIVENNRNEFTTFSLFASNENSLLLPSIVKNIISVTSNRVLSLNRSASAHIHRPYYDYYIIYKEI